MALMAADELDHPATCRGIEYLMSTQNNEGSWDEPYFTGTGFPGYGVGGRLKQLPTAAERGYQGLEMSAGFMINYHMYRNCWPLLALGRFRRLSKGDLPANGSAGNLDAPSPPRVT